MLLDFKAQYVESSQQNGISRLIVDIDSDMAFTLMRQLIDELERSKLGDSAVPKWSISDLQGVSLIRLHGKIVLFVGKRKAIMECLVRANGEPVNYETLHAAGWKGDPYDPDVVKRAIDHLSRELKKLDPKSMVKVASKTALLIE